MTNENNITAILQFFNNSITLVIFIESEITICYTISCR